MNQYFIQFYFQEARREEMMVNRLMRQSQQERRIAVQLLQVCVKILFFQIIVYIW